MGTRHQTFVRTQKRTTQTLSAEANHGLQETVVWQRGRADGKNRARGVRGASRAGSM